MLNNAKDNLAVIYLRVSTERQSSDGTSIDTQREYAEAYCKKHNLVPLAFFQEKESASKVRNTNTSISSNLFDALRNRPQLQQVLRMAQQQKFKHIIVYSRDRLIRNLEMQVALDAFFIKYNIQVHYSKTSESVKTENSKLSKFLELILGSVSELESSLISSRVRSGLEQRLRNGKWLGGRPPYGYILKANDSNNKSSTLKPSIYQSRIVEHIFNLYTSYGYGYRKIADILNQMNVTDSEWTKGKIESILKNETYTGRIAWNRRSRNGANNGQVAYSPTIADAEIVSQTQWKISKKIRQDKSRLKDTKYFNTPYLLRDKLYCSECGIPMKTKSYGKDKYGNDREGIYRCHVDKGVTPHFKLKKSQIEHAFLDAFSKLTGAKTVDNCWNSYCNRVANEKQYHEKLSSEIEVSIAKKEEMKSQTKKLMYMKDLDPSLVTGLEEELIIIENEINELRFRSAALKNVENAYFKNAAEMSVFLNKFMTDEFTGLCTTQKRVIIDILIDKIFVDKNYELEIIFNTSFDHL